MHIFHLYLLKYNHQHFFYYDRPIVKLMEEKADMGTEEGRFQIGLGDGSSEGPPKAEEARAAWVRALQAQALGLDLQVL